MERDASDGYRLAYTTGNEAVLEMQKAPERGPEYFRSRVQG